jgi:hypothetical protein
VRTRWDLGETCSHGRSWLQPFAAPGKVERQRLANRHLVVYEKELYFRVGQLAPSQRASQRGELKYAIPQISILINFAHHCPEPAGPDSPHDLGRFSSDLSKLNLKSASVQQPLFMEPLPFPLSSRAKPRDLRFRGPLLEARNTILKQYCHLDRTRISCHAAQDMPACAAFVKESSMKYANATKFHRKSGGA